MLLASYRQMLVQVCVCAVKVQVGFRDIIKWTICTNVDQVWRNIGLYLSGLEGILAVIIIYKPRAGQTTPDRGGSCVVKCSFVADASEDSRVLGSVSEDGVLLSRCGTC